MKTIGFDFLNTPKALESEIRPFASIDDLMTLRKVYSDRNQGNNSTFITKGNRQTYDIYGKVYGANKYETSMICYAVCSLADPSQNLTLYEMAEQDLAELPKASLTVLREMGNLEIVPTGKSLEKKVFEDNNLRSPKFQFGLLEKLGNKKCVLCDCEIPELVQGAHVWPIASIKRETLLSDEEKIDRATDGENGLWLCQNHHRLFDENLITFSEDGVLCLSHNLGDSQNFVLSATPVKQLPESVVSEEFKSYLRKRNENIDLSNFVYTIVDGDFDNQADEGIASPQ